jgi:hypothetical protein
VRRGISERPRWPSHCYSHRGCHHPYSERLSPGGDPSRLPLARKNLSRGSDEIGWIHSLRSNVWFWELLLVRPQKRKNWRFVCTPEKFDDALLFYTGNGMAQYKEVWLPEITQLTGLCCSENR